MVVQHNMQAMNANRMLNVTTGQQAISTEKLSSGYRINRAADDAAGLTISEKMRKQIRGLDRASTNAEDGVSSVQTAEGALTEVHSMLQRMNELATQAANGTNSKDSDRQAIQDEIDQLTTEIDRVSETTKFNETYLLKGDAGTKTINMKAHDAGLKGTLTDNGDGTATFVMDALNAGDKVSIGGKNYTIGGENADVTSMLTAAGITGKAGDKVTINGKEHDSQVYMKMFYEHTFLREACYVCPYKNLQRISDISIADAWGVETANPEFDDNRGVSLVLINTQKGEKWFLDSLQGCDFKECALEKYMQEPLKRPFKKPDNTENVWKEYNEVSFGKFVKNHYKEPFLSVVKRSLKRKIKDMIPKEFRNRLRRWR